MSSGSLAGVRVIELPAIGPVPFAAMMLADHGADVVRITRPQADISVVDPARATHLRGRPSLALDLRDPGGRATLLDLIEVADVILDGFRPGVLERLDLAPSTLHGRNPRLVIGRMTGWGQSGPRAATAGHDLNYIAIAGALRNFARAGQAPVPPLNLVGDFGGGAMYLLFGVLAALIEAQRSGSGQVVDAAMVDGTASLMGLIYSMAGQGMWPGGPGENLLDTGAPFYDVYRCADGEYLAVGCLEPQFYAQFLRGLGLSAEDLPPQFDPAGWPRLREAFTGLIAAHSREHWTAVFDGTDACVTPVLSMAEAQRDPHLAQRGVFIEEDGAVAPAVAPRMDRTPGTAGPITQTEAADDVLRRWRPPSSPPADW